MNGTCLLQGFNDVFVGTYRDSKASEVCEPVEFGALDVEVVLVLGTCKDLIW